jgi:hypothetical protein
MVNLAPATVTATLFGGMDDSLYADFKKGVSAMMNPVENTLKHTHGAYGPRHMASRGSVLEVSRLEGKAPLGSSGIQDSIQDRPHPRRHPSQTGYPYLSRKLAPGPNTT